MRTLHVLTCLLITLSTAPLAAQQEAAQYSDWIQDAADAVPQTIVTACGVTRDNRPIPALVTPEMLDLKVRKKRLLIVAGFESNAGTIRSALDFWAAFHTDTGYAKLRSCLTIAMVPVANPDGAALGLGRANSSQGIPDTAFPPAGTAYSDPVNPEAQYLWRWIGLLGPDAVLVLRPGDEALTRRVDQDGRIRDTPHVGEPRKSRPAPDRGPLFVGLSTARPVNIGLVWGVERVGAHIPGPQDIRVGAWCSQRSETDTARHELVRRQARTPLGVATELSKVYGHQLNSVAYIPALALIGRLRLGELTDDKAQLEDVERIVRNYVDGSKSTMGKRTSGSNLSGHLVFGELAARTGNKRYIELAKAAADLGFDADGQPRESMPFHSEMSDAVFMGGPILVQVGRLTGDTKYFDMALRHIRFMLQLNLRKDGLHQHSPLDPAGTAWGRGNGFPALGMALCLSDLPDDSPQRDAMLAVYRNHMTAMLAHQDEMGMWHQVVDHPESYRELTVSCMTTFAMTRGLRRGWLDAATYRPAVLRAWESIKTRIGSDGSLIDVCTGTGKQKSFRAYLDRKAILGRDDRGGAMALLVSTEIAFAQREGVLK